jgi:RsiW-degrading membrane proteinase PrsW (M82 family)
MKKRYLSVNDEPALAGHVNHEPDPAEARAETTGPATDDLGALRDSVAAEPALPKHQTPAEWQAWLQDRRSRCTWAGNMSVTLIAALLGGPFAIIGALISGRAGALPGLYAVVVAPVAEELLKQSGMTYVLEKQPYRVFSPLQFVFAAVVSGAVFAAIENVVYISMYTGGGTDVATLATFRWTVCTCVHVVCSAIASLGLVRAWRHHLAEQRPARLVDAFPYFLAAMVLHGAYNTWAIFFGP